MTYGILLHRTEKLPRKEGGEGCPTSFFSFFRHGHMRAPEKENAPGQSDAGDNETISREMERKGAGVCISSSTPLQRPLSRCGLGREMRAARCN